MAQEALAGGSEGVGIEESANRRVVISALEVIEPGLGIVVIAAVTEGVDGSQAAGLGQNVAPAVISIACCQTAVGYFVYFQNVTLQILDEVIVRPAAGGRIPERNTDRRITLVQNISDVNRYTPVCIMSGLAYIHTVDDVIENVASVVEGLLDSQPFVIVLEGGFLIVVGDARQFPAFRPLHGIAIAVVVARRIAATINYKASRHTSQEKKPWNQLIPWPLLLCTSKHRLLGTKGSLLG